MKKLFIAVLFIIMLTACENILYKPVSNNLETQSHYVVDLSSQDLYCLNYAISNDITLIARTNDIDCQNRVIANNSDYIGLTFDTSFSYAIITLEFYAVLDEEENYIAWEIYKDDYFQEYDYLEQPIRYYQTQRISYNVDLLSYNNFEFYLSQRYENYNEYVCEASMLNLIIDLY